MAKHRRRRGKPRGQKPGEDALRALGNRVAEPSGAVGPQGEPADQGGAPSVGNEAGLLALGAEIHRSKGRRSGRRRPRSRLRKGILIGLASLLLLAIAGVGYIYYITHNLNRQTVRGLTSALTTGREAGTENILMVGSTSRCALAHQNLAYGLCSQGVNGVNSDVIMLLHADPPHHRIAILSIPRDLFIPNARSTGPNKIDAGLYQGISQVVAAVEEDFGIPIQHAVSLNFDQFANVVDALGGISMAFPISVFDASSGLNVKAAPCVFLTGTQALQVVRARHLQYDAPGTVSTNAFNWPQETQSDLARIRRNHEFLRVLATAVARKGLGNPISDLSLINSLKSDLTFDQSWPVSDMVNLVYDFHATNANGVPQLTLPVSLVTDPNGASGGLIYKGSSYGDSEFPALGPDLAAIEQFLGVGPDINTMTGQPLPAPSAVNVSVMNGSGAYNQATTTAASLTALGFHVAGVGDVPSAGDVSETVVYYGSRSADTVAAAQAVVRSLSGAVVMAYNPKEVTNGAQVTVVTGTQFAVNAPATPAVGATTTAPTTSTTTTVATSGAIATPTPPNSILQPWDPRACAPRTTATQPLANRT